MCREGLREETRCESGRKDTASGQHYCQALLGIESSPFEQWARGELLKQEVGWRMTDKNEGAAASHPIVSERKILKNRHFNFSMVLLNII